MKGAVRSLDLSAENFVFENNGLENSSSAVKFAARRDRYVGAVEIKDIVLVQDDLAS